MITEPSVYDTYAPRLTACGFFPLPIGPGSKVPRAYVPSENRYENLTGWNHPNFRPRTTPQPGAGIGVRCGLQPCGRYLIALDFDHEGTALKAIDSFPGLRVTKAGRRGFTGLYQSAIPVASRDFRIGNEMVLQVLSDGKQTVLPPSAHPDVGVVYQWTCDTPLYDVRCDALPEWPEDWLERIETMLRPFGYESEPEKPQKANGHAVGDEGPCRELNNAALANLQAWIPELGLEQCHRQRGRFASYRAKASYRQGAEREDSLSFTGKGIVDFGTGEKFTPLNIVMRVRSLQLAEAFDWLKGRVSEKSPDIEIDFDALANNADPKGADADEEDETDAGAGDDATAHETDERLQKALSRLKKRGAWAAGDDLPTPPKCAFEGILPKEGLGNLDGQWGVHKTHVMVDVAVAFAATGESSFAGRKRLHHGGVIIFESEESEIPIRLACAAKHRGIGIRELPIFTFREIQKILLNRKVNPQVMNWYRETLSDADYVFKKNFGVPLAMVAIDPLIDAYGAEKENSPEEANEAKNAFRKLSKEFGILFWINDHMGKDVERGSRGSSAKPSGADFIFTLPDRVVDPSEPRPMWVRKLRNIPGSGAFGVNFTLKPVEVDVADGTTASNLVVVWGDEVWRGDGGTTWSPKRTGRPSRKPALALDVLQEMVAEQTPKTGSRTVIWVPLRDWYEELISRAVIEAGPHQARDFQKMKDRLMADKEIKIRNEKVCIPL
jgi:hypothetical protein